MTIADIWRRGQVGWPRSFPIAQLPNAPLLVAIAGRRLERSDASAVRRAGQYASAAGMTVWAWRETTDGANWLRRLLGVAAFVSLGARLARGRALTAVTPARSLGEGGGSPRDVATCAAD